MTKRERKIAKAKLSAKHRALFRRVFTVGGKKFTTSAWIAAKKKARIA